MPHTTYRNHTIEQLTEVALDFYHRMVELELTWLQLTGRSNRWPRSSSNHHHRQHYRAYNNAYNNYHNALTRLGLAIERERQQEQRQQAGSIAEHRHNYKRFKFKGLKPLSMEYKTLAGQKPPLARSA